MKRRVVCSFLLGVVMVLGSFQARAADNQFSGPLKEQWDRIRNMVVKSAEAVPEDKYDFKPTPEVRSFRDQFVHIIGENFRMMGMASGDNQKPPENLKTRAEIVKALNDSYDFGAKVLGGMTDAKAVENVAGFGGRQVPRWTLALMNIVDNMDHYGNLVVYMRLNGIVPPSTAARPPQGR